MSKKLHLISLGCTKNLVDSEVMLGCLSSYENTQDVSEADVVIVNTCGFIEAAKQESIQTLLHALESKKNGAILVASGCLSERYAKELKQEIPEIDIITGVGDYDKIDAMIQRRKKGEEICQSRKGVFLADENNKRVISGSNIHAYIKLSEGCNQKCSFCAIPSFKGKLHSRTLESTLKEVQNLVKRGFRDFSFIAQDSSSYMRDLGVKNGLVELIKRIDALVENGLELRSARILYLYPSTTSKKLIQAICDSKVFVNYFDMPLQHISKNVLKIMGRSGEFRDLLDRMRMASNSFVRTSFIIGHPGESEQDFIELCEFIKEFSFDRMNLFAFSKEEGTKSATMEQIPQKIINARLKEMDAIFTKQYKADLRALVGREIVAIIEGKSQESEYFYSARDVRFAPSIDGEILINDTELNEELKAGYYRVKITEVVGENVIGCVIGYA
ncbi:30S ribosomal protein S12 methylthiotransferase RimO [Helicobacter turcicus]|uniref:Ribosomal protein uS12 methylthiotransferase RimO n=1 Tax=Helicobacter turcicus TaxID=2867412 RepID=A0ABS7JLV2_9HELI|nr:30S ribosomal protein S12 methylthiotransferase RimO [Helicobacter turcicus]MBX7490360.1 30S ribosomal protein S12 methylthiotransferase RimO [Helicobacter turcicus]MBX7545061.1 30S ribosomal protein S12 methylthiotransferase RimO [Helicobacter turcicus]